MLVRVYNRHPYRLCGVQVHVGWLEGGTAVFAFRGTASKQDGLQDVKIFSRNIDYLQELYPGVKAHLGMNNKLAELLISRLADWKGHLCQAIQASYHASHCLIQ